jgi:5-hydroxyisourate hydrolase
MSVSTHVLDVMRGAPAAGVVATLSRREADGGWTVVGTAVTDAEGRVRRMTEEELEPGEYRLHFATESYFDRSGLATFYPEVAVVFNFDDAAGHLHIPLLLSQFGYTTYKGG